MASTIRCRRVAWSARRLLVGAALMAGLVAGCSNSRPSSSPATSIQPSSTTAPDTSTTLPGPQASGSRTVLSPIGLNVRGAPSPSAPVLGTAAEGVVLTVLGYTDAGGGWFKVKGATVTGWISAQPTLSVAGAFQFYSSSQFAALYPATWAESALPGAASSVVFRPASGAGDIVVTAAASVSQLPQGRSGYSRKSVSQVVACGITAGLVVFQQSGASPSTSPAASVPESLAYLGEIRFAVDPQDALGLYADMPDLGPALQIFKEFVASLTFSAPQCSG